MTPLTNEQIEEAIEFYDELRSFESRLSEKTEQLLTAARELLEVRKDKERLDWIEKNNAALNQLKGRDAVKFYWHIWYVPEETHNAVHFGDPDTGLLNLRQAIDAAMGKEKE